MKHKWRMADGVPDDWAWESGFHNGVYCERCGARICVHCHPDWEEMDDCVAYESEPQTNADRIRAMSDEELVELLLDGCRGSMCSDQTHSDYGSVDCFKCRMDWLRQPVKDGENE